MTTLAVSNSATVSIRDGGTVTIATNGGLATAVVTPTVGASTTVSLGPLVERRILGPYSEGASIVLTNSSCVSFDYEAQSTLDPTNVTSAAYILAQGSPNLTLNDTSGGAGTTMTAFPVVVTVPGGRMGATSKLRVTYAIKATGGNAKTVSLRIGQAATATFATATGFGGQSGLAAQTAIMHQAIAANMGSTTSQYLQPANMPVMTSSALAWVQTSFDTGLDLNIWIGFQFGTLNGGDTATLLWYTVELLP